MTTATSVRDGPRAGEPRIVLPGVGWHAYDALTRAPTRVRVRMSYDRGDLELMSPSAEHEYDAVTLGMVVEVAAEVFGVEVVCLRNVTLRREDLDRGLEPDNAYYTRNWRRISGKKRLDLTVDPPPDLAIEIDITASSVPREGIYAALGVPEVWRYDSERLAVLVLDRVGAYLESDRSPTFPEVPLAGVVALMDRRPAMHDQAWRTALRDWLRERRG